MNEHLNKKIRVVISLSCIITHCKSTCFTLVQNICTPNTLLTLIFKMLPDEQNYKAAG